MKQIIAVCGFIGSGKGTAGDILVRNHGYVKYSFADGLKDAVSSIFGWPRHLLEGATVESRAWREQVDPWWAQRLDMPNLTPRWVLQYWGTEVGRQAFHNDIWVANTEMRISQETRPVVIPDCRFPNEVRAIKKMGGKVFWVRRGPLPEWYNTALTELQTSDDDQWMLEDQGHLMEQLYPDVHDSEWRWIGAEFDAIIYNEGNISDLEDRIRTLIP
jgi:hypothetical protein